MRRPSSRLTSGRKRTPRTRVKMAAFAPMPSARVITTVAARPLLRMRERAANFRSFKKVIQSAPFCALVFSCPSVAPLCWARFRGFHFLEILFEAIEAFVPKATVIGDPLVSLPQASRFQTAGTRLGITPACNQTGFLENLQMLRDGRHAHLERLRDFGHGRLPGG